MKTSKFNKLFTSKRAQAVFLLTTLLFSVTSAATTSASLYYVDSIQGNDAYDGTSATVSNTHGPWKTLGRLAKQTLSPGSEVILACGSKWNETLSINGNGNAKSPITVTSLQCTSTSLPSIDGSINIATQAWQPAPGLPNVFMAPVPYRVMQVGVLGDITHMNVAHYPDFNSNVNSSGNNSFYLQTVNPANGYKVGIDLADLPSGATLDNSTTLFVRDGRYLILHGQVNSQASDLSHGNIAIATSTGLPKGYTVRLDGTLDPNFAISQPIPANTGYYLTGNKWMLNTAPGQWLYQAPSSSTAQGVLYVRLPDDSVPSAANVISATTLALGINLNNKQYINISNLAVSNVFSAVEMKNSNMISFSNSNVSNAVLGGIQAAGSINANISNINMFNIRGYGVMAQGGDYLINAPIATGTTIAQSTFNNVGVLMEGETSLSLPLGSTAISAGYNVQIANNSIQNTGYAGIIFSPSAHTNIVGNTIQGACSTLTDCGAIYTGNSGGGTIAGNIIQNVRGNVDGLPTGSVSSGVGIYIDDLGSGFTISNNTVSNADHGIQLHRANNNKVINNQFYGNHFDQVWLQDGAPVSGQDAINNPTLKVNMDPLFGNLISGNVIAPAQRNIPAVRLSDPLSTTTNYAAFSKNTYVDTFQPGYNLFLDNGVELNLTQWSNVKMTSTGMLRDQNSVISSRLALATSIHKTANSLAYNGLLDTGNSNGWCVWNVTTNASNLNLSLNKSTLAATPKTYVQAVPSYGTEVVLFAPTFTVTKHQWYRMSVDVQASVNNFSPEFSLPNTTLDPNQNIDWHLYNTQVGTSWKRIAFIFQATSSGPTRFFGHGAWNASTGNAKAILSMANFEVVPIESMDLPRTDGLVNTNESISHEVCPTTNATLCAQYLVTSTLNPSLSSISFPSALNPVSASIAFTKRYQDSNVDGIADIDDKCHNGVTPIGTVVNSQGCMLGQ
jgi:parallel beta-helix repeat protein